MRILSGVIIVEPAFAKKGEAIITFNPHKVDGNATGGDLANIGGATPFHATPGGHVALRAGTMSGKVEINDDITKDRLSVRWDAAQPVHEISYLVYGE